MSEIDKLTESKKTLGSFINKVEVSVGEIEDMELNEDEKEALRKLREAKRSMEQVEEDIDNKDLFSP